MVVPGMETLSQYQAAQFRVALLLKKYRFGAVSAAKYLGKPRGLVQSWMQIGNKHYLAKEKIKIKSFEKILKELRKKITKEHLNYFLAKRLMNLELPIAFISNVLSLPTSTVRSWKYGKVPVEIKKFFHDHSVIDIEFNKLLKSLRKDVTSRNLEYFLALRLAKIARVNNGRRNLGGRLISKILTNHFGYIEPIPEKTISCWIDGKRKPWDAFQVLSDERKIQREFNKIVDELTYQHMTYHISKYLADKYNWNYSRISKELGIDKELVRGWVKKDRGNPVAKSFVNEEIVNDELLKYVNIDELKSFEEPLIIEPFEKPQNNLTKIKNDEEDIIKNMIDDVEFDSDLERELIYHLETIPTGVSSPKVLQSILIDHQNATLAEIEEVLRNSKHIIQNKDNSKWVLKHNSN